MTDRFDWHDLSDDYIAIRPSLGVAVYKSDRGYLVVRQEGYNGEDDTLITINPEDIESFYHSVGKVVGE